MSPLGDKTPANTGCRVDRGGRRARRPPVCSSPCGTVDAIGSACQTGSWCSRRACSALRGTFRPGCSRCGTGTPACIEGKAWQCRSPDFAGTSTRDLICCSLDRQNRSLSGSRHLGTLRAVHTRPSWSTSESTSCPGRSRVQPANGAPRHAWGCSPWRRCKVFEPGTHCPRTPDRPHIGSCARNGPCTSHSCTPSLWDRVCWSDRT